MEDKGVLFEVHGKGVPPKAGDLIWAKGRVMDLRGLQNPWSFKRERWYTVKGIAFPLFAYRVEPLKARSLPFLRQEALNMRSRGIQIFSDDLGEQGNLLSSLVLGFRRGLDWETRSLFTGTGVGHLLAVSGFHMGVAFFLFYSLSLLILKTAALSYPFPPSLLPSRIALLPSLAALSIYLILTGAHPSAVRAFVMIGCYVVARFLDKERSLEGALLFAFLIMVIWNPLYLLDVGFQLTFTAMIGVVLVVRGMKAIKGWRAMVVGYVAMAFVIPLFTLPFVLFYFHRFSPYTPLANLVFVPPVGLLIILGMFHLLFSPIPPLKMVVVPLEKAILLLVLKGLSLLSSLPGSPVWATKQEALCLSLLAFLLVCTYLLRSRLGRWITMLPLCSLGLLLLPHPKGALLLDMGKRGRSLLLQEGSNVLVDAGASRGLGSWSSLRNALLWRDVKAIDALILTRLVPYRASLSTFLLKRFRVKRLYLPESGERRIESAILEEAARKGVEVVRVKGPMKVSSAFLTPKGKRELEVMVRSLSLRETHKGWYQGHTLLRPWEEGAIEIYRE